jgi:hypothetical protein
MSQTLAEAKELYLAGEYDKALPVFEKEYNAKPTDASLNQWYGVCLFKTGGDLKKAEECLILASNKRIREAGFFLGELYTQEYRFEDAEASYDKYESLLKKRGDDDAKAKLAENRKVLSRLSRMADNTEDIQIIDSLTVNKDDFLSAYKLSQSGGKVEYFNTVFSANKKVNSTVYFNEKESKIYYAQPDTSGTYFLSSMEKLLDKFGNEKRLSEDNFGLNGSTNYPFIMPDGVTIYFAAEDDNSIGGYDLFVSRYNLNNDTYLNPERLNMPFNSIYNDYMMVIDEEKGVGWFASDRFQSKDSVCIYTFIPNPSVQHVQSDDDYYKSRRALITSIKDSWREGVDYAKTIALAQKTPTIKKQIVRDFTFVINDQHTYYKLEDFKDKEARDLYYEVTRYRNELKVLEPDLEKLRADYSKMSEAEKGNVSASILDMERREEWLKKQIPELEVQARNKEIGSIQ